MSSPKPGLVPEDFVGLLSHATELPIIGGQAVHWWSNYFSLPKIENQPLTSRDLDLWADRAEVKTFGKDSKLPIEFPGEYDMTVLSGIALCTIGAVKTQIEFLHTVPGLDINARESTTVKQKWMDLSITLLDPISLLITKLHALRNFRQDNRQDALHLKVCLLASNAFITEALGQSGKLALWYVERILRLAVQSRHLRLAAKYGFDLREAIPIQQIQMRITELGSQSEAANVLDRFLNLRWPEVNKKINVP